MQKSTKYLSSIYGKKFIINSSSINAFFYVSSSLFNNKVGGSYLTFLLCINGVSLFFKINILSHLIGFKNINSNTLLFFKKKTGILSRGINGFCYSFYKNFVILQSLIEKGPFSFYTKLNLIGLGYKNFVVVDEIFFLLGDCNYLILSIPDDVKLYCKKSQIYLFSSSRDSLMNFASKIMALKEINYYKGKGFLYFKNFKFIKLKTGKKQRFM